MDDFDTRLRARLLRLADGAPRAEPVRPHPAPAPRMRAALPAGAIVTAVVLVAGMVLLPRLGSVGPAAGTSPTTSASVATASPSASPRPSGGITRDQAIELASHYVPDPKAFISAQAERYRDAPFPLPGLGRGNAIAPNRWVWAVTYQGEMLRQGSPTPTPAEQTSGPTPPTAVTTVLLDYFTGGFLRVGEYGP